MRGQKGFVLLDAIAGIMILCVGVTCLVTVAAGARQAMLLSQWKTKAANATMVELEELQSRNISDLIANESLKPGEIVSKTRDSIDLQLESEWLGNSYGLLRVKVTANWLYGPGKGKVVYETMLNRR